MLAPAECRWCPKKATRLFVDAQLAVLDEILDGGVERPELVESLGHSADGDQQREPGNDIDPFLQSLGRAAGGPPQRLQEGVYVVPGLALLVPIGGVTERLYKLGALNTTIEYLIKYGELGVYE